MHYPQKSYIFKSVNRVLHELIDLLLRENNRWFHLFSFIDDLSQISLTPLHHYVKGFIILLDIVNCHYIQVIQSLQLFHKFLLFPRHLKLGRWGITELNDLNHMFLFHLYAAFQLSLICHSVTLIDYTKCSFSNLFILVVIALRLVYLDNLSRIHW